MTWNIWWKFGPWQERQDPILNELRRVDADIVSLQEVWADANGQGSQDQAEVLGDALGFHVIRSVDRDGLPQRFGNAILSREPMQLLEQVYLPDNHGNPTVRTALIAKIDQPPGPRLFVATHLEWKYGASATRQRQLQFIVDTADRWRQASEPETAGSDDNPIPIILTGDLNGQPETQEIRRLTGLEPGYHQETIFIDSWAAVGDGPGHTWTRDNPHSELASWPRRRLDFVLVSWPRAKPFCSPLKAELVGTNLIPISPSDHYGVVVDLDDRTDPEG